ncbi:uncharacterized protein LOC127119569 [Lathyrus oleraceus]|nr:uncharacterized protein LOC127119569 [Pisum sativum]
MNRFSLFNKIMYSTTAMSYTSSSPSIFSRKFSAISKPTFCNLPCSTPNHFSLGLATSARNLSLTCSYSSQNESRSEGSSSIQGGEGFLRDVLESMQEVYLKRNPTAKAVLDLVHSVDNDKLCYDHLAFRTFGVNGYGIESLAGFFLDYGYTQREELKFPKKKLRALWFSPPADSTSGTGSGMNGPLLPRIFISELLVDQMSPRTQEIIKKYTESSGNGNKYGALASSLGHLTWGKPLYSEFQQLASESEYAAWTLVNGHALNHVTISTHWLKTHLKDINKLNEFLEKSGFKLNSEGGVLKVSPDGLLQQSSTVADSVSFQFSDGITESVPCSYIEFAERLVLPQYENIPHTEVKEFHRRDGFEAASADKIFESTSKEQLSRVGGS